MVEVNEVHYCNVGLYHKVFIGYDGFSLLFPHYRGLYCYLVWKVDYWFGAQTPRLGIQYLDSTALLFAVEDEVQSFGVDALEDLVLASYLGL